MEKIEDSFSVNVSFRISQRDALHKNISHQIQSFWGNDSLQLSYFMHCPRKGLKIQTEEGKKTTKRSHHLSSFQALGFFCTRRDGHTLSSDTWSCLAWLCFALRMLSIHFLLVMSLLHSDLSFSSSSRHRSRDCNNTQAFVWSNPLSNPAPAVTWERAPATLRGCDPSPTRCC